MQRGHDGVRHPHRVPHPPRQRIFITGASSGLGRGMAREFAARGRDLVLAARRLDRLHELRAELLARHPGIRVVVGELDVDDPDTVAAAVPGLAGELGGIDRFVANAGIGDGAAVGTGAAARNRAILATNVLGTHATCEAAVELFRAQGTGHLVVVSSVASIRGMRGTRATYGASKAALNSLAESIRSDFLGTPIRVTTVLPGYIETDLNVGRRGPFTVDLQTGVRSLTASIEREPARAYVPEWPWRPVAGLLRVLPLPVVRRLT